MKFTITLVGLSLLVSVRETASTVLTLPSDEDLVGTAFPFGGMDGNGKCKERKPCTVDNCEWNPYYLTK
eukprot:14928554-Ditylum_brightwellii.AAC.1